MTDAHCHIASAKNSGAEGALAEKSCAENSGANRTLRELVCGRDFVGAHPWWVFDRESPEYAAGLRIAPDAAPDAAPAAVADALRDKLAASPALGVGEIGLDRLKEKEIPPLMRELFAAQCRVAAEMRRRVVLHGAKCWGQVVAAIERGGFAAPGGVPAFLFHGFSRSDGLLPDIVRLNGFISIGPAILNDHAVNYRALAAKVPLDRLLVETDRTAASAAETPPVAAVLAKLAEVRGMDAAELERITDANAERFMGER